MDALGVEQIVISIVVCIIVMCVVLYYILTFLLVYWRRQHCFKHSVLGTIL